jgi:hypothetical protein
LQNELLFQSSIVVAYGIILKAFGWDKTFSSTFILLASQEADGVDDVMKSRLICDGVSKTEASTVQMKSRQCLRGK